MQVSLSQTSLEQYLSIVKSFMLEIHQRIGEEYDTVEIEPKLISIIDRASLKIKAQKQQIQILELQLKQAEVAKISLKDVKNECSHLDKRLTQKCDQISILRQTVKTLYQDNERLSSQKQSLSKEISTIKESNANLKKKLKRQEDDLINHKNQLKKITIATEEKLSEYIKEDQRKQGLLKKHFSQLEKNKSELSKKQKTILTTNKRLEELKSLQQDYDKVVKLAETLKEENCLLINQIQHFKSKHMDQKALWLKQADSFKRQIECLTQKIEKKQLEVGELTAKFKCGQEKILNYQSQIIMRTQKLKQKNKQIKLYSEQINKLGARVDQLSVMSSEVLADNQELTEKCHGLEERLQQLRAIQTYATRVKGDMNNKKSMQLGKLMESLNKLHSHG